MNTAAIASKLTQIERLLEEVRKQLATQIAADDRLKVKQIANTLEEVGNESSTTTIKNVTAITKKDIERLAKHEKYSKFLAMDGEIVALTAAGEKHFKPTPAADRRSVQTIVDCIGGPGRSADIVDVSYATGISPREIRRLARKSKRLTVSGDQVTANK